MARIVNAYLDLAKLRTEEQIPMTMEDWVEQFEGVLRLSKKEILNSGDAVRRRSYPIGDNEIYGYGIY